jgi:hypothetical protein
LLLQYLPNRNLLEVLQYAGLRVELEDLRDGGLITFDVEASTRR